MLRPAHRWTAALLCLATLLTGCGDGRTTAEKKAEEGYLIINNLAEPSGLDPQTVTGLSESHIVGALFEGLVNYDPKDLHPIPGIAESWTMSADGKTWTFRLRKAARWSNGDPITAADFLFSYERMLRPSFGAEYASMLHGIRGAKDFAAGKTKDFRSVGLRAPDPHTLVIELEHPIPYFLQLVCHHSWIPVHPPTILKFGSIDALNTPWTRPASMVCSGAFTLESWEVARRVVVRKNPLYWNAKEVALNAVEFRAIADLFAEERAFRGGELHVTGAVPPYKVAKLREAKAPQLRIDPFLATAFVWVNCDIKGDKPADVAARKALTDPRVRRALGMAIDRNLIAEKVLRAGEKPALHFTPPGTGDGRIPADRTLATGRRGSAAPARRSRLSGRQRPAEVRLPLCDLRRPADGRAGLSGDVAPRTRRRGRAAQPGVEGLPDRHAQRRIPPLPRRVGRRLQRPQHLPRDAHHRQRAQQLQLERRGIRPPARARRARDRRRQAFRLLPARRGPAGRTGARAARGLQHEQVSDAPGSPGLARHLARPASAFRRPARAGPGERGLNGAVGTLS
ncbi:MAG: peptide ABC transporter substrate-binding protein [Verrucomicrobia bacterium]|nr:peptide ABC transporter substrate-binding protein [Verrucomicrobiota bacterium]